MVNNAILGSVTGNLGFPTENGDTPLVFLHSTKHAKDEKKLLV